MTRKVKVGSMNYYVICREDLKPNGTKGDYALVRREGFDTLREARAYARTISGSREPKVLKAVSL